MAPEILSYLKRFFEKDNIHILFCKDDGAIFVVEDYYFYYCSIENGCIKRIIFLGLIEVSKFDLLIFNKIMDA
ncbi:hypothetical protein ACPB8Q_06180 [Methanocaldococcus indicus]|uniref:hypothetical protein n=1 Tax=Methanocaldococcus indicus TaxID=213231 RepID=UPI003C6D6406